MRQKKCKVCGKKFTPGNTMQKACSPSCALVIVREKQAKEARAENRKAKAGLKTRSQWLKEAQTAFNAYIRARDEFQPCISCGRHHEGKYDAGHYRTTKANPSLRFSELNCHKQCVPCNRYMSGNIVEYRINLERRIGAKALEWLEGPHGLQHLTIEDAKEIKAYYRQKCKDLKEQREN